MSTPLAGLRRLVDHAHAALEPHAGPRPQGSSALYAVGVNEHAAKVLALQVLALVSACLPDEVDDEPPADEPAGAWVTYYDDRSAVAVHRTAEDAIAALSDGAGRGDQARCLPWGEQL